MKQDYDYRLIGQDQRVYLECPIGNRVIAIPVQSGFGAQGLGMKGVLDYMEPIILLARDNRISEETFREMISDVRKYLMLVRRDVKRGLLATLSTNEKGEK